MALSDTSFGPVRFSGYMYIVGEDEGIEGAAGLVFNYQNNKNFNLLTAVRTGQNKVGLFFCTTSPAPPGILETDQGEFCNRSPLRCPEGNPNTVSVISTCRTRSTPGTSQTTPMLLGRP